METKECKDGSCCVSEDERSAVRNLGAKEIVGEEKKGVHLFGKNDCPLCSEAKKQLDELKSAGMEFETMYFDLDTVDGLSKAAYCNAFELPVIIVFKNGKKVMRWDNEVPDLNSLKQYIS